MIVLRSVKLDDLEAIVDLAREIGPGMTTLKPDRVALRERVRVAAASFAGDIAPCDADYLFVLENMANGRVCGVSAIKAAVGVHEPFYNYRVSTSVHACPGSEVVNRVQSLHLSHDLSGDSELCSLYLHPDFRSGWNGKLLSKARLIFVAQFKELFAPRIFAEMRGFQNEHGVSPFWESVARPFFKMDFREADDLCGRGDRQFIEHLVPRLPIYTHLLGAEACAAIGRTHSETMPARRLLEQEGLRYNNYIDIFDGGPVLQANIEDLRAARESRTAVVCTGVSHGATPTLVATSQPHAFRAVVTMAEPIADYLPLAQDTLDALGCAPGTLVRMLALTS